MRQLLPRGCQAAPTVNLASLTYPLTLPAVPLTLLPASPAFGPSRVRRLFPSRCQPGNFTRWPHGWRDLSGERRGLSEVFKRAGWSIAAHLFAPSPRARASRPRSSPVNLP